MMLTTTWSCRSRSISPVVNKRLDRFHFIFTIIVSCSALVGFADRAQGSLVVGSFDVARGGFDSLADAPEQAAARAGIQAIHPDVVFASTSVLTSSFLSNVDVLTLGGQTSQITAVTPLSAAEQTALFDFVLTGGNLAIFTDNEELDPSIGDASRASLLDPFGLQTTGLSLVPSATVTDPQHPIVEGPFGTLAQISIHRSGWYTDLGPYAHAIATENAFGLPMLAAIEYGEIAAGSGRAVFISDSNVFDQGFASSPILFGNLVAYLVPEPDYLPQLVFCLVSFAAYASLRRHRRNNRIARRQR